MTESFLGALISRTGTRHPRIAEFAGFAEITVMRINYAFSEIVFVEIAAPTRFLRIGIAFVEIFGDL